MFGKDDFLTPEGARNISPVVLAFVGDAVYSLYVRERLVKGTDYKTGTLQKLASQKVSARGQSELAERMLPLLTDEEADVYRRGRNAHKAARSKNASVGEYNRSTGFEALLGYLYLTGRYDRIEFLIKE